MPFDSRIRITCCRRPSVGDPVGKAFLVLFNEAERVKGRLERTTAQASRCAWTGQASPLTMGFEGTPPSHARGSAIG